MVDVNKKGVLTLDDLVSLLMIGSDDIESVTTQAKLIIQNADINGDNRLD